MNVYVGTPEDGIWVLVDKDGERNWRQLFPHIPASWGNDNFDSMNTACALLIHYLGYTPPYQLTETFLSSVVNHFTEGDAWVLTGGQIDYWLATNMASYKDTESVNAGWSETPPDVSES